MSTDRGPTSPNPSTLLGALGITAAARARRAWRETAARHHLSYQPDPVDLPTLPDLADGSSSHLVAGSVQSVRHHVSGPLPRAATLVLDTDTGTGAACLTGYLTASPCRSYHLTWATAPTEAPSRAAGRGRRARPTARWYEHHVVEMRLPAKLPCLVLGERDAQVTFSVPQARHQVVATQGAATLHTTMALEDRFVVRTDVPSFARAALSAQFCQAALMLPPGAWFTLHGQAATLTIAGPPAPQSLLPRLQALTSLLTALPGEVWRSAGIPLPVGPVRAPGWEHGLPSAPRRQVPAGWSPGPR